MKSLSWLLFVGLQIAFIPLAIIGVVLIVYRQMVVSRRLGVSQTAIEVLNCRWIMHVFDIHHDIATSKLAATVPNTSTTGLWLCLFPLWLKYKMSGELFLYPRIPKEGEESLADIVTARTLYFNQIIESQIGGVEQFVLMGAGYDTRAYGTFQRGDIIFFELDQPLVQQYKRSALAEAGIDAGHVRFAAVDFSRENAMEKLKREGLDFSKKTIFLWEGVTLYLSEEAVRKTMQEIHSHAAPGSVLVADIYADRYVQMGKTGWGKKVLEYTNEGFGFSLPFISNYHDTLSNFVESEKMLVGKSFFMGSENEKGPFMVVVEMRI